jgi:hypothetical protein
MGDRAMTGTPPTATAGGGENQPPATGASDEAAHTARTPGAQPVTGGCQCGAVRFYITAEMSRPSICHCRMCQKAIGAAFGAFAIVPVGGLVWTQAEPAYFQSSNVARRGFCAQCGTSLTWESAHSVDVCLFALDEPLSITPEVQLCAENAAPWLHTLGDIPSASASEGELADHLRKVVSHQHPDHEIAP